MELRNEPKIGLELRLKKVAIIASVFAVLITIAVFIYTNLSSSSDTFAGTQTSTNSISGKVFCDIDQDESQDAFEADLSGVTVYLYNDANGNGVVDSGEDAIDSTVTDGSGEYSFTTSYSSGNGSISVAVSSNNDDAQEKSNGKMYLTSNYQKLNNRTVAFRFQNVQIPQGTTISSASITVNSYNAQSNNSTVTIYGEDIDDSPAMTNSDDDITDRTKTTAKEDWDCNNWGYDVDYTTPDISDIIQEIVNRSNWVSGNDITIIIEPKSGSNNKKITARDYSSSNAPVLDVSFSSGSGSSTTTNKYLVRVNTDIYTGASLSGDNDLAVSFSSSGNSETGLDFGFINACGTNAKNQIRGKAFNDANKNGNQEGGESGLANVKIRLYKDKNSNGTLEASDELMDSTTTDQTGSYTFNVEYSSGGSSFNQKVSSSSADAHEKSNGDMDVDSDDLKFVDRTVGIKYSNVTIPNGATITSAYVRLRAKDEEDNSSSVYIYGEDVNSSANFTTADDNISDRTKTSARETWDMPDFDEDEYYNTPDISDVIQEIVDRSGWASGNDLGLIFVKKSGEDRKVFSYDGSSSSAPELFVTYTSSGSSNNYFIVEIDSVSDGNVDEVIANQTIGVSFTNSGNQSAELSSAVFNASALPVELIYFNASLKNSQAELVWATAMEENNSHFEVQRSVDGRNFEKIGEEAGNGNSQNIIEYKYYDDMVPVQDNPIYYRLKQVDFDGVFEYSPVVYVRSGDEKQANVYPNPAVNFINISKNGYRFDVTVLDRSGNLVMSKPDQMDNTQLSVSGLPNGFYVVQIISRTGEESYKVIVQH